MSPLQILKKDFLAHTDRLRYVPGLQGQRVSEDGIVRIGDRAGPGRALSNTVHELAHFVEIDDARQQTFGWGLHVPTVVVCGQTCTEPTTHKMVDRELRVMAYQVNLMQALGAPPMRVRRLVQALQYMPDFILVPLEDGRPAYGEGAPSRKEIPYEKVDPSRISWMVNRVQELRAEFTFERFRAEWFRKIALLG